MTPRLIRLLLAPLLLWAAHFFIGYGFALALPSSGMLDSLILALTLAAEGALAWLWLVARELETHRIVARHATILAAIAIAWQGLVILF